MEQSSGADNRQGTLTTEDLAWLGGLMDGEGHIVLCKKTVGYVPVIGITNTDVSIVEEAHRILDAYGVGHWICHHKNRGEVRRHGWAECLELRMSGEKRCRKALEILRPYIRGLKAANADLLGEFLDRRLDIGKRAGSWSAIDDSYYGRMKLLNGRDSSTSIRQTLAG